MSLPINLRCSCSCVPLKVALQRVFAKRTPALFYADVIWIAVIKTRMGLVVFNSHPVSYFGEVSHGISARAFYCNKIAKDDQELQGEDSTFDDG